MEYWVDLFTGTTWTEFRKAGSSVSGFRASQKAIAKRIKPGDVFVCYLTGVMRWVGALEVIGPSDDKTPIWKFDDFPVRFAVKPLIMLTPETGTPMDEIEGRVSFFEGPRDRGKFKGFVRNSPRRFRRKEDGDLILDLLRQAEHTPVTRPVDPKKLARKPLFKVERKKGKVVVPTLVSVPEPEPEPEEVSAPMANSTATVASTTRHTEIQFHLLSLGAEMGFDLWVARNDRNKKWTNQTLGELPGMVAELPTQFNRATNQTIELIDVLWLKGNSIVAAFEVESTTSIYSGLLRMSDLLALQPNLEIDLFLVAPDDRRDKVEQELMRPTFNLLEKPLSSVCGFLAFSKLMERIEGIRKLGLATSLKPTFLKQLAEFFGDDEADA
ncbi:MAG: hypothetical protein ABSH52_18585 [Terriglobia bacterium]|jgi:hypothetical protein